MKNLTLLVVCLLTAALTLFSFSEINRNDKKIKIAMAQIFCLDGDKAGNFVRIENAIKEAKEQQADIVVFPETALLGWVNPDAHKRAAPIPGTDSDKLCELAKKYKIHVCIGLAEKETEKF